jgi:1-acyl-sn-glycerol-3-phosphate acyltransferase
MILRFLSWIFKIKGWKLGPSIPSHIKKCVVIAAPHTSNWDFVYAMGALHLFGIPVKYLAKKDLFKWPLNYVLTSTGGIPIDRSKSTGMVDAAIKQFAEHEKLVLMIAGEGTRGKVEKWKSGFYHVAMGAGVPLMLAYLDYAKKEAGFGQPIYLSGDKEKDAGLIRDFYAGITAKHPDSFSLDTIKF